MYRVSHRCWSCHLNQLPTFEARFWAKVQRAGKRECWFWTGSTDSKGYGKVIKDGGLVAAHRASWELAHGPIPLGASVLHRCDNPPCVNPMHLFTGSQADNIHDAQDKGRFRTGRMFGTDHPKVTLTRDDCDAILSSLTLGWTHRELANAYNVSTATISNIANGKHWSAP